MHHFLKFPYHSALFSHPIFEPLYLEAASFFLIGYLVLERLHVFTGNHLHLVRTIIIPLPWSCTQRWRRGIGCEGVHSRSDKVRDGRSELWKGGDEEEDKDGTARCWNSARVGYVYMMAGVPNQRRIEPSFPSTSLSSHRRLKCSIPSSPNLLL